MTTPSPRNAVRRASASPAWRMAVRLGYLVNGLINVAIGVLALGISFSGGSHKADPAGALAGLARAPGGQLLIWVIAVGLLALGFWQLALAVGRTGSDRTKLWAARVRFIGKGVAYLALAYLAIRVATHSSAGGSAEKGFAANALSTPGGVFLVVIVGLLALGIGIYLIVKGARRKFLEDVAPPASARQVTTVLGVIGYVSRGIAIAVIGVLFLTAAITAKPSKAGGLDAALSTLAGLPFGKVILVVIALGFIAFGIYSAVRARYARF